MGGMGPIGELHTDAGKIFAGVYALYCGLVELVAFGIFAAPIFHRFMHHFHLEGKIVREVSFAIWQISLTTIGGCQRYTFGSLSPMAYNRQQPMVFRVDLPNDKQPTPWAKHKNLW
jgi:hypothetical protein